MHPSSQIPRNDLRAPNNSPLPNGPSAWCPSRYLPVLPPVDRHHGLTQTRVLFKGVRGFSRYHYLALGQGRRLNSDNRQSPPSPTDGPRRTKTARYHHFPWMRYRRRKNSCRRSSVQVDLHIRVPPLGHTPMPTVLQAVIVRRVTQARILPIHVIIQLIRPCHRTPARLHRRPMVTHLHRSRRHSHIPLRIRRKGLWNM